VQYLKANRLEHALRSGVDVVVGTPGRMQDLLEKGSLRLSDIQHVVLDEADEMLDMGFADDIEKILREIPQSSQGGYQVLLFSATIPPWVKEVARKYLKSNYITVDLVGNSRTKR
jgi:ATP-dependent RNA helicase DDX21